MQCPFCKTDNDRVVDSRVIGEGSAIRRRRKCLKCHRRFTTYERIEAAPHIVVKKDGRREFFSRKKILSGMVTACQKRSVSLEQLELLSGRVEAEVFEEFDGEVSTHVIGEKVGNALRELDQIAFVRFASVYREFKDVRQFLEELAPLLQTKLGPAIESLMKDRVLPDSEELHKEGDERVSAPPLSRHPPSRQRLADVSRDRLALIRGRG